MSRNAPILDEEGLAAQGRPSAGFQRRPDRRTINRQRDLLVVGVLTPTLLVGLAVGVLVLAQAVYPDTYVEPTAVATPTPGSGAPTPVVVLQPIDTARLNAGVVDKPPPYEWPDVPDLKVVPNPGRPSEQADYTPVLSAVDTRRLIAAASVSVVMHQTPQFAQGAVAELAKAYPVRARQQRVIDLTGTLGYVPDESTIGLVVNYASYRVQIETVAASPPFKPSQRADAEYFTLHLADHITRRLQEMASGGHRTAPEEYAVHMRDHLSRSLPFGG